MSSIISQAKPLLLKALLDTNAEWVKNHPMSVAPKELTENEQYVARLLPKLQEYRNETSTDSTRVLIDVLSVWMPIEGVDVSKEFEDMITKETGKNYNPVYDPFVVLVPLNHKGGSDYELNVPFIVRSGTHYYGTTLNGEEGNEFRLMTIRLATSEEIASFVENATTAFWKMVLMDDMYEPIFTSLFEE